MVKWSNYSHISIIPITVAACQLAFLGPLYQGSVHGTVHATVFPKVGLVGYHLRTLVMSSTEMFYLVHFYAWINSPEHVHARFKIAYFSLFFAITFHNSFLPPPSSLISLIITIIVTIQVKLCTTTKFYGTKCN